MLFNVKVVSAEEYEAHLADLAAKGQTGQLGMDLARTPGAIETIEEEEAGH
jgi:cytochrome c oxidase subunit 2